MTHLKLGTRRSLLAWAQSSWVARELERLNPGVKVELVGIETRGDKIQNVSLQSVAGKEFFVAELDDALRAGNVDFTVHSMKDLSLDRPGEFTLGAIPKRENPRDVVLFGPGVIEKLRAGKRLRIGTSSPRRVENIPQFLERALPSFGVPARVELVEIRGNVNTRLGRVHEPEGAERQLDAVVLAFAGLIRLWADPAGRPELEKLLQGVRWMVLPLSESPSAPAQGALAIECRADDRRVRDVLARLHDERTASEVARERQLLADWGGGCHQKFGATAIRVPELEVLLQIRGRKPDGAFVDELRWNAPPKPSTRSAWDGSAHKTARAEALGVEASAAPAFFVAHSRAAAPEWQAELARSRVWTSGVSSWIKLASQGIWVEGCAEGLGYEQLAPQLETGVLRLPAAGEWTILTHDDAAAGWRAGRVIATYRLKAEDRDPKELAALSAATQVFWSSGSQFDALKRFVSANATHACGPGKTLGRLRAQGIRPLVFPSVEEWRKWVS